MPMIIGINPVKKRKTKKRTVKKTVAKRAKVSNKKKPAQKKTGAKRKVSTMARKKRRAPKRKTRTITQTKVVYRAKPKRNPRKNVRKNPNPDTKMTLKKILRGSVAAAAGMLVAKAAVNKLTTGGSETERWTWTNIGVAGVSSVAAALIAKQIFSLKQPTTFFIAAGGVALMFYKIFTTKLAPKWGWSETWFGADDDINPELLGADDDYLLSDDIDILDDSGMGYLPGQDDMGATNSGGRMVPFNPAMGATESGGQVVAFNPAMGSVEDLRNISMRAEGAYPG